MNDFTSFVDVAGRVSRSTDIHHRVTAAAVTFSTYDVQKVRSQLPAGLGKWRDTTVAEASAIVDFIIEHSVAVGIFSVNKRTAAWEKYWQDSLDIEDLIRRQDGGRAGFVRAPNFLRFHLMGGATSVSFGHAFHRTKYKTRIVDCFGHAIIEQRIVFDNDVQGAENEDMLQIMLSQPMPKSEAGFGFKAQRHISLKTEEDEPLLLWPISCCWYRSCRFSSRRRRKATADRGGGESLAYALARCRNAGISSAGLQRRLSRRVR